MAYPIHNSHNDDQMQKIYINSILVPWRQFDKLSTLHSRVTCYLYIVDDKKTYSYIRFPFDFRC